MQPSPSKEEERVEKRQLDIHEGGERHVPSPNTGGVVEQASIK
jgi:hypothetical protein